MSENKINKIKLGNTTYDICGPATSTEYGLIKIGYTLDTTNKNYPVELANGKAFVNVPWENTQYTLGGLMGSSAKGSGTQPVYWNGSSFVNTTCTLEKSVPSNAVFTDTTYSTATTSSNGLMSVEDKEKLDNIATNANNYVLPVAGSGLGGVIATPHSGNISFAGISTTPDRYYQVEVNSSGKAFVNVPWVSGEGGSSSSGGFTSITAGGMVVSSSTQPDLYISSNAGITAYIDQGQASLSDKNVLYIDINEASSSYGGIKVVGNLTGIIDQTANNYPVQLTTGNQNSGYAFVNVPVVNGEDGEDGNGIQSITITYQSGTSNTAAPSGTWSTTVPNVTPGNYLWTKILITCTDGTTTTAYSVARQGVDGTNGSSGSGASAMTILPSLGTNSTAEPNILYRLGLLNSSLTITLADTNSTLSSSTVAEYLFRFKTGSSSTVTFTTSLDNVSILYPFDYVLNANTEYEVSVLWDGSSLLVRNCAYQSNS